MSIAQRVAPMLAYEDGGLAMDWLIDALGLVEKERWLDENGRLIHGELMHDGQSIFLAEPTPYYQSPKTIRENYAPAAEYSKVPYVINGVMLYVPNVDLAYKRAEEAGARILGPIEEGFPGRRFRLEDPEGQRWFLLESGVS